MKNARTYTLGIVLAASVGSLSLVGCGGGDSGAGGFRSIGALTNAMTAPSGTVDETSATGVAASFEGATSSSLAGIRQKIQGQSATVDCSGGGSLSASGNENEVFFQYNNCTESGCTMNGSGAVFLTTSGEFSECLSYDLTMACQDELSLSLSFSGCLNGSGQFTYLVEYEGETYAVSGSYSNGTGELTITGENGTYVCTYTNDTGTCSGDGGESFSF